MGRSSLANNNNHHRHITTKGGFSTFCNRCIAYNFSSDNTLPGQKRCDSLQDDTTSVAIPTLTVLEKSSETSNMQAVLSEQFLSQTCAISFRSVRDTPLFIQLRQKRTFGPRLGYQQIDSDSGMAVTASKESCMSPNIHYSLDIRDKHVCIIPKKSNFTGRINDVTLTKA